MKSAVLDRPVSKLSEMVLSTRSGSIEGGDPDLNEAAPLEGLLRPHHKGF